MGITMANTFQAMLEHFRLTEKILLFDADNAMSNDKQTDKLNQLDNSFHKENHIQCFNHTIQLSAKALLKPFNTALSQAPVDNIDDHNENVPLFISEEEEEDEHGDDEDIKEVEDDNINELEELGEDECTWLLAETTAVCSTITKVSPLS